MRFCGEMGMEYKYIESDTSGLQPVKVGDSLYENRSAVVEQMQRPDEAEISIYIVAYNRLEKTKRCVESVLKYTSGFDYELTLIDNGSTDGTLEYFRTVPYEKKTIIRVTGNVGAGYPQMMLSPENFRKYICFLANDLIVTPHWMENLLRCMESDPKIGMVNPVSSNVSNLQQVDLSYRSYEEMQRKAERFNVSDSRKWEDRLRLITLGTLYRKELLMMLGWPLGDSGFFHDFGDDDMTFKIRRSGYRTVLAGDTWICHDHDYSHGEGKDPVQFQQSLEIGRENFREKYYGIDAWQDVNNYLYPYLNGISAAGHVGPVRVLGVDVRCGTPILDVRNWLRRFSVFDTELSAFIQDPKYWLDLKTICRGQVLCDREEFLADAFPEQYFDYVVIDRSINCYHEPQKMINDLFSLCKSGGMVICKLKNAHSFLEYAYELGQWDLSTDEFAYNISLDVFCTALSKKGNIKHVTIIPYTLSEEQIGAVNDLLPTDLSKGKRSEVLNRLLCKEYLIIVKKN